MSTPVPGALWQPAAGLDGLVQALLDFEQQPGRYALALREPRALFEHTHAVMLLAAGRPVEGLPPLMPGQHTGAVQRAARYFVRTVLLRPGTDHYSLLGLKPDHSPEALRDHYRLMIRLTHPDFAQAAEAEWPPDAASRINLANDVLGSVVKRAEYDATLAAAPGHKASQPQVAKGAPTPFNTPFSAPFNPHLTPHLTPHLHAPPPPPPHGTALDAEGESERLNRSRRRRKIMALAAGGAVVCAALLWLMSPGHNDGSLVAQRAKGEDNSINNPNPNPNPGDLDPALSLPTAPMSAIEQAKAELAADAALAQAQALAKAATETGASSSAPPARRAPTRSRTEPGHNNAAVAQAPPPASGPPARTRRMSTPADQNNADSDQNSRLALALDTGLAHTPASPPPTTATAKTTTKSGISTAALALVSVPVVPAPAPASASTEPSPPPANEPGAPRLTMAQVQHQLSQVLSGLQSGQAENATQWLDGHWRDHPAASNFVNAYQRQVAGQQVVQVGKVMFRSRQLAEHFVVDGSVELYLQNAQRVEQVKEMNVSAYFLSKEGRPVLTQLVLNRTR